MGYPWVVAICFSFGCDAQVNGHACCWPFPFYFLSHSAWHHKSLPWDWLAIYAGVCVFLLLCHTCSMVLPSPLVSSSFWSGATPLAPGGLQYQPIAQTNKCCSAVLVCRCSRVPFSVWFCPINFCTVPLPLLQSALHSRKFSVNTLRFPCPPLPQGTDSLSVPLLLKFASHTFVSMG